MHKNDRRLNLDWVNVTYRSVLVTLLAVVGISSALWFGWSVYKGRTSPRGLASREIDAAEELYQEAASYKADEKLDTIHMQARAHLADARKMFDEIRFEEARVKAIMSRNNSQKIIDIARSEETTRSEVRFYKISGGVKVKRMGNLVWETANLNEPLREGDAIKTASSGSAQIIYFDGSVTTIKPGSLVEIRNLVTNPRTRQVQVTENLRVGGVHAAAFGSSAEGSVHEVATENTVARARTSEKVDFEVNYDAERQSTDLSVHEGEARVSSGQNSMVLAAAERVEVRGEGKFGNREKILPAPALMAPSDHKIFLTDSEAHRKMELIWRDVRGVKSYRLQVSRSSLMDNLKHDLNQKATRASLSDLGEGEWFWRVAAVDSKGNLGRFSSPSHFKITTTETNLLHDQEPPALILTDVLQTGNLVIISGSTDPDANLWVGNQKVDVYEDGSFTAVIRLHQQGRNELEIIAQDPAGNETVARREAFLEVF